MAFDLKLFENLLQTRWIGRSLQVHDTLDSTNHHLKHLCRQGNCRAGMAVLALQQESGRGQWGRTWTSAPGGLYLSVLVEPHIPAENGAQLTLCTALGIAQQFRQLNIPVDLKWPNDLLLQGKKLGGILTELILSDKQVKQAVIGIGLNWRNPVPDTGISLADWSSNQALMTSLEELTALTLLGLEQGYDRWQAEGIAALIPDYLNLLVAVNPDPAIARLSRTLTLTLSSADLRSPHAPSNQLHNE